jgi:repressor LexA
MKPIALTERQKEIVDFIRAYRRTRGISPTQREICEHFRFSSFGTLQKHIRLLLEKGVLVREWNKRRSLLLSEEAEQGVSSLAVEVPLLGVIAAGKPIEGASGTETVAVPDVLTKKGENYVLRVRGNSMIDDGIQDGDYVVILRKDTAENGEMIAALVQGEATLKRFYREADGRIRLQPANEKMAPMFVSEGDLRVQGVVVGLMRRY